MNHDNSDHGGISCAGVQSQLKQYVTGRLPESTSNEIATHLGVCPACATKLRQMHARLTDEGSMVSVETRVVERNDLESVLRESSRAPARNMLATR